MWIVLINLFLLKNFQNQSQIYKARKLQFCHGFSPPEQAEMCTRSQEWGVFCALDRGTGRWRHVYMDLIVFARNVRAGEKSRCNCRFSPIKKIGQAKQASRQCFLLFVAKPVCIYLFRSAILDRDLQLRSTTFGWPFYHSVRPSDGLAESVVERGFLGLVLLLLKALGLFVVLGVLGRGLGLQHLRRHDSGQMAFKEKKAGVNDVIDIQIFVFRLCTNFIT